MEILKDPSIWQLEPFENTHSAAHALPIRSGRIVEAAEEHNYYDKR